MGVLKEFKEFAMRGNVVDRAITSRRTNNQGMSEMLHRHSY
jgi:hypothetical protein